MKLVAAALITVLLIVSVAHAGDTERAAALITQAIGQVDRGLQNNDAGYHALVKSAENHVATINWYENKVAERDARIVKAEANPGYRVWNWCVQKLIWLATATMAAYSVVLITRAIGLGPASGGLGAIFSGIGTLVGGFLPFGGHIQAAADNYFFRVVKPLREEIAENRARKRLAAAEKNQ